jgi:hypothetical protein
LRTEWSHATTCSKSASLRIESFADISHATSQWYRMIDSCKRSMNLPSFCEQYLAMGEYGS